MKKLLCGFLCVAASAALAVDSEVATVDVTAVSSPLTNTIVAISVLDLSTGGNLAISNLVETSNLKAGDKLYAFDNGRYECWTLSAGKIWTKSDNYTVGSDGNLAVSEGAEASATVLPVGKGIWLYRQDPAASNPFYVYGAHSESKSVTISATSLVGNPTQGNKYPTITGCVSSDQIAVPTNGTLKRHTYIGTGWRAGGVTSSNPPAIDAGTGFWYVIPTNSAHSVTISW